MARRSRAREIVLQVLYRFDLNPDRDRATDEAFVRARLHNHEELVAFAMSLINGVLRNRDELDAMLAAKADNWRLSRMAATDRNVLRLGAFEILYADTPGRVAINEAVELARRFGSAQSSQFVNGILDRFLRGQADLGSKE
ncbi:MAG: transcription antitermination factor NusB [Pirellulaceae bacterium]|nr:transcription antitermination factor NusB [Planctomycetales bacterium]